MRPLEIQSEALARRAQQGDRQAWEELVSLWDRPLFLFAVRLLGNRHEAEDVRQQAWLRMLRSFAEWRGARASFSSWAYRILLNLCRDRQRAQARSRMELLEEEPWLEAPTAGPPEELLRHERRALVAEALACLPAEQRACLVLRHFHRLSVQEISRVVDRPRTTVHSMLSRALSCLGRELGRRGLHANEAMESETRT